ncbi:hypothetical protein CRG98_018754, partial [Punica granatum]
RVGSNRIARPKEKPPGRALGRTGHVGPNGLGLGLRRKRNGPRPVSRRSGSEEDGGDGAAGGGSRPWTPLRLHERAWEMALDTADASPWSIGTSPALNQLESGENLRFSDECSEFSDLQIGQNES